jgi:DNA-binding NtrC family response regulator
MLADKSILIVEDSAHLPLDLAEAVERLNGRVVGPVETAAAALAALDNEKVDAAILDYELPNGAAARVAQALIDRNVPFVIHTGSPSSPEILLLGRETPILIKPIQPQDVVSILAHELIRAEMAG